MRKHTRKGRVGAVPDKSNIREKKKRDDAKARAEHTPLSSLLCLVSLRALFLLWVWIVPFGSAFIFLHPLLFSSFCFFWGGLCLPLPNGLLNAAFVPRLLLYLSK